MGWGGVGGEGGVSWGWWSRVEERTGFALPSPYLTAAEIASTVVIVRVAHTAKHPGVA